MFNAIYIHILRRIEDLIERYFENKVSEEERSEVLKLIQEGRIEEAVKDKIVQTLSDRLRSRELPDFEMSAKGEEIFQVNSEKECIL